MNVLVERGLYAGEGYGSAHDFCVGRLCLSDAQAYHRLAAAQVAARFPQVLEGLRRGALTLTNVALLRPHLTEANAAGLLAWAEGRRKHEVEREIRRLAPRPDVAVSLRRLPITASPSRPEVAPATGPLPAAAGPAMREVALATAPLPAPAGPALREAASSPRGVAAPGSPAPRDFTAEPFPAAARLARPDVAPSPGELRAAPGSLLDPADETRGVVGLSVGMVAAAADAAPRRTGACGDEEGPLALGTLTATTGGGTARPASAALDGGAWGCDGEAGDAAPQVLSSDAGECEAGSGLSPQFPIFPAPSGRRAEIRPLSPARYSLRVTISEETHAKLRRARDLLGHAVPGGDLAEVLDRALTLLVERLEQRKCGAKKGRGSARAASAPAVSARARESSRPGRREQPTDHGPGARGDQRTPPPASNAVPPSPNQPAAAEASETPAPASAPEQAKPRKRPAAGASPTPPATETPAPADTPASTPASEVLATSSAAAHRRMRTPGSRAGTTTSDTRGAPRAVVRAASTFPPDASGPAPGPRRSRYIPAAVRRAVWERDQGRCAFVGPDGRCAQTRRLEFHHRVPFAEGGASSAENLVLACVLHNQWEAARWFGEETLPAAARTGGAAVVGAARAATGRAPILTSQNASGRGWSSPVQATAGDSTTPAAP